MRLLGASTHLPASRDLAPSHRWAAALDLWGWGRRRVHAAVRWTAPGRAALSRMRQTRRALSARMAPRFGETLVGRVRRGRTTVAEEQRQQEFVQKVDQIVAQAGADPA